MMVCQVRKIPLGIQLPELRLRSLTGCSRNPRTNSWPRFRVLKMRNGWPKNRPLPPMHIAASAGAEKALRIAALKAKRDALQAESVAKRARSNPLVTPEEEARERARISDAAIRKKGLESALGSGTPADSVFSAFNYLRQPARACQLRRPPFSLTRCDSFFLALYFVCFRYQCDSSRQPFGWWNCFSFDLLFFRSSLFSLPCDGFFLLFPLFATLRCSLPCDVHRLLLPSAFGRVWCIIGRSLAD